MTWDEDLAAALAATREIDVIVPAPDQPAVRAPIWVVSVDGSLYVRSWKGEAGRWYRRARRHGTGSIAAHGLDHAVHFEPPVDDPGLQAAIVEAFLG